MGVQLNILRSICSGGSVACDVPPPVDMVEFGENIAVGRAYIGVRVPDVKLAAPGLEERVGLVTVFYGIQ